MYNSDTDISKLAKEVIEKEASAVANLKNYIDKSFTEISMLIFKSKGRLVITGIGKSAIIANKIVATMNSTGTPAIFMHAADAIHGDLGIIQENLQRIRDLAINLHIQKRQHSGDKGAGSPNQEDGQHSYCDGI